jgi:hypothetical protein
MEMTMGQVSEVNSLNFAVSELCYDKPPKQVIAALWPTLIAAIMKANVCTHTEAVEHIEKMAEWSRNGLLL